MKLSNHNCRLNCVLFSCIPCNINIKKVGACVLKLNCTIEYIVWQHKQCNPTTVIIYLPIYFGHLWANHQTTWLKLTGMFMRLSLDNDTPQWGGGGVLGLRIFLISNKVIQSILTLESSLNSFYYFWHFAVINI